LKKKAVSGIMITLSLTALVVTIRMIAVDPVSAMAIGGLQPQPFESSPTLVTFSGIGTPTSLASTYDKETDTEGNFYMVFDTFAEGIVTWRAFEDTPVYGQFPINWVDLKFKYRVPTATIDDTYRIEYKVDPDATWYVLKPDVAGEKFDANGASRTYPWANLDEPNDGAWDWTDIGNLNVRVVGTNANPGSTSDMKEMYVAEVWLSIYNSPPPVMSPTMSVVPGHIPETFDFDMIFVDVYVRDVTQMLGFTVVLGFDPTVLLPVDFMVYYPFETMVISEIGTGYVSVDYVTFNGDGTGFSGDTPIVRIWFYAMLGTGWSDLRLNTHDIVDILNSPIDNTAVEGDYNKPNSYMSYQGSLLPPGDPTGTRWHELYPTYCDMWTLTGWGDNDDGNLTVPDQIEMVRDDSVVQWFYVDRVTITIHFTFKAPIDGTGDVESTDPVTTHPTTDGIVDPIGTHWHMICPEYSREFVITSHDDANANGALDPSEQFDFEFLDQPGVIHWAHLDDVTTDIILSKCTHIANKPPVADANGPYTGTEGVPLTFDGSGSNDPDGAIFSYEWDFGDGYNGTGVNPTHTYAQNDTYTVTLTVTDNLAATDTNTTTATINDTQGVAVTDVMSYNPVVYKGHFTPIGVTVENQGDFTETFNVTAYYCNETLTPEQWDTFWSMGDVNEDGYIDMTDFNLIVDHFGTSDPQYDIDESGLVDTTDIMICGLNQGLDIWIYFGSVIGTQTVNNLPNGVSTTLTFIWNTTDVPYGNYTISAVADTLPDETDTTDNTYTDGWVLVTIPGDICGDPDDPQYLTLMFLPKIHHQTIPHMDIRHNLTS